MYGNSFENQVKSFSIPNTEVLEFYNSVIRPKVWRPSVGLQWCLVKDIGDKMSHCIRKSTICICENKGADQLRGNREADLRLCLRYTDSKISFLVQSKISSFLTASVTVQAGLCQTVSETQIPGFLTRRLKSYIHQS